MAAGSRPDIISRVTITPGFAIAFRGFAALETISTSTR
jgi:hypothetical protein